MTQVFVKEEDGSKSWAILSGPQDEMPRLVTALGSGWRLATLRERVWHYLTAPRFSWRDYFLFILVINGILWVTKHG